MNRLELTRSTLLPILFILSVSAYGGKLYRWTDDNGRVHYSDKPAKQLDAEVDVSGELRSLNIGDNSGETERVKKVFPQPTEAEMEYRRQRAERDRQDLERHRLFCEGARRDLSIISGRVIFLENGKPVPVSEDERQRRAVELEKLIQRHCRK